MSVKTIPKIPKTWKENVILIQIEAYNRKARIIVISQLFQSSAVIFKLKTDINIIKFSTTVYLSLLNTLGS